MPSTAPGKIYKSKHSEDKLKVQVLVLLVIMLGLGAQEVLVLWFVVVVSIVVQQQQVKAVLSDMIAAAMASREKPTTWVIPVHQQIQKQRLCGLITITQRTAALRRQPG